MTISSPECDGPFPRAEDLPDSFGEVLVAARAGDGGALAALWDHYSRPVAGFARARGAREVDEITNDVFLAAFAALDGFEGDASDFRSLLFTIARRRIIDDLRRRSRRLDTVTWQPREDARRTAGPEDDVLAAEAERLLLGRLDQLTPDQREVILLRLVADLSLHEVADVVGKRVGTVKSLQRRGLDALRRSWGDEAHDLNGDHGESIAHHRHQGPIA